MNRFKKQEQKTRITNDSENQHNNNNKQQQMTAKISKSDIKQQLLVSETEIDNQQLNSKE